MSDNNVIEQVTVYDYRGGEWFVDPLGVHMAIPDWIETGRAALSKIENTYELKQIWNRAPDQTEDYINVINGGVSYPYGDSMYARAYFRWSDTQYAKTFVALFGNSGAEVKDLASTLKVLAAKWPELWNKASLIKTAHEQLTTWAQSWEYGSDRRAITDLTSKGTRLSKAIKRIASTYLSDKSIEIICSLVTLKTVPLYSFRFDGILSVPFFERVVLSTNPSSCWRPGGAYEESSLSFNRLIREGKGWIELLFCEPSDYEGKISLAELPHMEYNGKKLVLCGRVWHTIDSEGRDYSFNHYLNVGGLRKNELPALLGTPYQIGGSLEKAYINDYFWVSFQTSDRVKFGYPIDWSVSRDSHLRFRDGEESYWIYS